MCSGDWLRGVQALDSVICDGRINDLISCYGSLLGVAKSPFLCSVCMS